MNRILKGLVLSAATAATVLTSLPAAQAHDRWHHRDRYVRHHDRGGDALAAGVIGLAAGALAGAALSSAQRDRVIIVDEPQPVRRYYEPAPQRRYYAPRQQVVYAVEPWSNEWYRYCSDRYRSFNPSDGTFVGYDGVRRFCQAN